MMEEVWKDIKGYEGCYQISNLGNVKSLARMRLSKGGCFAQIKERVLKLKVSKYGYLIAHLRNNDLQSHAQVHRLVADAFIPNTYSKPTVNHIDSNKENNCINNLEWSTHSEQMIHAFNNNLVEVRGSPKYSKKFKKEIFDFYNENEISIHALSVMFNISERTAGRIANDGITPRKTTRVLKGGTVTVDDIISKEQVLEIKELRMDGHTLLFIACKFNRSISQIHRIINNKSRTSDIE